MVEYLDSLHEAPVYMCALSPRHPHVCLLCSSNTALGMRKHIRMTDAVMFVGNGDLQVGKQALAED